MMWVYYGSTFTRFVSGLHNTLRMIRLIEEDHLSHAVFYDQNGYSLICPQEE